MASKTVQRFERRPSPAHARSATDVAPLTDLAHGRSRTGPVRTDRPVYADLLPPCNAGCPAGENIQGWMAHVKVGEHEQAWRLLTAENPFPAIQLHRVRRVPRRLPRGRGDQAPPRGCDTGSTSTGARGVERASSGARCTRSRWCRTRRRILATRSSRPMAPWRGRPDARHHAGNEATVSVAHRCSEVCCIFPITPSSPMAELADEWSSKGRTNLWGTVPAVVDMQSEGGAAGALERAVASVEVPVTGNLNGVSPEGWTDHAGAMQDAGAAAIELNIYYLAGDPEISGRDVEQRHIDILERVKVAVTVPVAVRLAFYFSSPGDMALRLDRAGADALVLFNRFLQPEIDPEQFVVLPRVNLSSPADARLAQAWIALLRGRLTASLSATSGVEVPADLARYLLAGADVVMTTSALLWHGPAYATDLLDRLRRMASKSFQTLDERSRSARGAGGRRRRRLRAFELRHCNARCQCRLLQPLVSEP